MPSKLLTVTEYAKLKGITRQTVLSKIKRGVLKAARQPHSNIYLIEAPSVSQPLD